MNTSKKSEADIQKSDRYCALALICLVFALVSLGVGVFVGSPTGVIGIVFLCLGVLLMLGCIVCFALYSYYGRNAVRQIS